MRRIFTLFFLISFSLLPGARLCAQQLVTDAVKVKALTDLAADLNQQFIVNHQNALSLAAQKNWTAFRVSKTGTVISLQGLNELGKPVFYKTDNNIISAATTQTTAVQPGGTLGLNLSGSGANLSGKLGEWDAGSVYTSHQEFAGKSIINNDGSTVVDHTTHVAGTMIAKGVYAPAKGMAFNATSLLTWDYNNDLSEMSSASKGLLLSNHSYGYVDGWNYNSNQSRWEWYGLPGDSVDYDFGFYNAYSQLTDSIAFNAPQYLIVRSAGNSRGETGPPVGSIYYGYNTRTDFTLVNKGPRPSGISNNDAYDVIASSATSKNILTVGAVNPLPYGPSTAGDIQTATFSSWGPTDDGRIKPDICGDGVNVLSTGVTAPNAYLTLSGTSMASPNVTGSLYLLQEYYAQKNSGAFMRAATLKGLACHTAFDAGNPGPDYIYGWGLLDMNKAAQAITNNGTFSLIAEKTLSQGQTQTTNVVASGNGPLIATICWTDHAGTPTPGTPVNDRTPKLVNDLDIRVTDASGTYFPWVLDPAHPSANATNGDNIRDNIEQVYIAGATPGKAYTVTVSHKGILKGGLQAYSLIVTGIGGSAYCASGPASSADSRINNVTFSNVNNTPSPGCASYSNYTNLTASLEQGKTYPLSITAGTCGANFNKIVQVYIDWNGNGSFTDSGELVATSGVIAATGTFNTTVTVPTNVAPGNYSLMRVVLAETNTAASISPCGTYGKGETQDYRVLFMKPVSDVGIIAVNNPAATGACASGASTVSVKIKNYGTQTQTNIPVTVTLTSASKGTVTTLSDTYTGNLLAGATDDLYLSGTFNALPGDTYAIAAATNLTGDEVASNNQITASALINNPPAFGNLNALYCTDAQQYNLNGSGDGVVFWYKNIADALPFTFGSSVNTLVPPVNGNYYAGLNDFGGTVGPVTKNVFSAGGYNQFGPSVLVKTAVPVVIKSARLYIGNSGTLTFTVTDSTGTIVSTANLNVTATRTSPGPGALADDPNDQGKVYNLNLTLPAAGKYTIAIGYPDNATLYRNNGGVTGYPFSLNNIFSLTGNSATSPTNAADTTYYRNFYYYFYNMQVQSLGCISQARATVPFVKPAITLSGTNLTSNYAANNHWYLNGSAIAGATGQIYTPLRSGIYRVDVISASGCVSKSDNFSFVLPVKGNADGADISLGVFPVPASNQVNIAFNAVNNETFNIAIVNAVGQSVYKDSRQITAGPYNTIIDVSAIADGVYFTQLKIGDKIYTRKIPILK